MGDMRQFSSNRADATFSEAVKSALNTPADPNVSPQADIPRLDDFLLRVRDSLESGSPEASAAPISTIFRKTLREGLSAPFCSSCSKTPCAGTFASSISDVENIEKVGRCIAPIKELFAAAFDLARQTYAAAAAPRVLLNTEALLKRPEHGLDLAFSAATSDVSTGKPLTREVSLKIHARSFDFRDYFAMLYVFFHEIFCHAFSGIPLAADIDGEAFSEGWMDWVAAQTLVEALKTNLISPPLRPYAREMSITTFDVHQRRYLSTGGGIGDLYETGRLGAERLCSLFAGCLISERGGWAELKRFSLELNQSTAPDGLRGDLVHACNALIRGWSPSEAYTESDPKILQLVEAHLRRRMKDLDLAKKIASL